MNHAHKTQPSGWADDRLMNAYDAIHELIAEHAHLGMEKQFRDMLSSIEALDEDLAQAIAEHEADGIEDARDTVLRENASAIIRAERARA